MKPLIGLLFGLTLLLSASARADGAFPGGMAVVLPREHPGRLHVASTFGLLTSEDNGAHWYSICERAAVPQGGNVLLYMLGAGDALFALSFQGFAGSTDGGRTWFEGGGSIKGLVVLDAFPDPSDASFVLVIAAGNDGKSGLYPSSDGGKTFGDPVLLLEREQLRSVEFSREPAGILYVTTFLPVDATSSRNALLRSTDRGEHWERHDITTLANGLSRIAQVDPADGDTLYLRVTNIADGSDSLGIVTSGGTAVSLPIALKGSMGGFARGEDGTLFVGGLSGGLWSRAVDATEWDHRETAAIQCLGARGDTLYACGQGSGGAFALGESKDHGKTFAPIFDFNDIVGPVPCDSVQSTCAADWESLSSMYDFIGHDAPTDGSFSCGEDSIADGGTTLAPETPQATMPAGCSCGGSSPSIAALMIALAGVRRRVRPW